MKSQTFKTITGVIGILGVIGSILSGFIFKTIKFGSGFNVFKKFNIQLCIGGLISTLIICLVFYGISCILLYLEDIKGKLDKKETIPTKNIISSKPTPVKEDENTWECPSCGKINQNYVGTCGCGTIKPN